MFVFRWSSLELETFHGKVIKFVLSELGMAEKAEKLGWQIALPLGDGSGPRSLNWLLEDGGLRAIAVVVVQLVVLQLVVVHDWLDLLLLHWLLHHGCDVGNKGHILHVWSLRSNWNADHSWLEVGGLRHLGNLLLEDWVLRGVNWSL